MAISKITDDQCIEALQQVEYQGSKRAAAKAMGITIAALYNRLRQAAARNLDGHAPIKVPEGMEILRESQTVDKNGDLFSQSFKLGAGTGEPETLPDGHRLKASTIQVNGEGRVERQWLKSHENGVDRSPEKIGEIISSHFTGRFPKALKIKPPKVSYEDLLTTYIFTDWHYGLFAYGRETEGPDWDLDIADRVLREVISELVDSSPPSGQAVILGLGDLLHADDVRNVTARSGNVLDVDTRYSKCLGGVCDLLAEATSLVAAKHDKVDITFRPGNHDENSTVGITQAMRMYWRQEERVTVDQSPSPFYWKRFGTNLIGGVHGDRATIKDLPMIMANRRKQDWAETNTRHMHTGHIHHDTAREDAGVTVYSHRAPVAQDAYHAAKGYLSGRSVKSFTYHRTRGHRGGVEIEMFDEE